MQSADRVPEEWYREPAAALAFAVIRFEEGAAHQVGLHSSHNGSSGPIETYSFVPSAGKVPREEVVKFLMALSSPAFLAHTTLRGAVSITLLSDVQNARRERMQDTLNSQRDHLQSKIERLGLADSDDVLLEVESEQHVFPVGVLRHWCELFVFEQVGWTLDPLQDNPQARARLYLMRADGAQSVTSCEILSR